ncbi:hypothetical protein B1H18_08650 [Streptomyces tsukubensis]|uniref:Uncharacterized protein n=1 Tax=Streptomyces tsukubensis TaxID=83656 RepID=A0A1V4AC84_9ACTN|nr:hypothetical protein B1H18_08650 [Streptomyces tsukubensis]
MAVTSPDLVLPSPDRYTPTAAVLRGPRATQRTGVAKDAERAPSLDASLTEMHTLLEQHGYVIALCPTSLPAAVTRRLYTVRAILETDRLAILRPELPPLGVAALTLQLRQLSICDFTPGVLASAARLLSHYVYAGAVLGSVARLDRVPVTLRSHAKSWVPGAQFAVLANPRAQLVRVAADATLPGPEFATTLHVAHSGAPSEWVTDALAAAWRAQAVTETGLPEESARWWASGKLVEFAAAIPDISVLYQLVSSVRREECHWCGLELIGDRCGFCSAPLPPPERRRRLPAGRGAAPALVTAASAAPAHAPALASGAHYRG